MSDAVAKKISNLSDKEKRACEEIVRKAVLAGMKLDEAEELLRAVLKVCKEDKVCRDGLEQAD